MQDGSWDDGNTNRQFRENMKIVYRQNPDDNMIWAIMENGEGDDATQNKFPIPTPRCTT